MAKIFSIDPRLNETRLPETRTAEIRFTVTNGSPEELRGKVRAVGVSPCESSWLSPSPESVAFTAGQAREISVNVAVPPDVEPGTYSFHLDAASERNPDGEKTEGPVVSFVVPPILKPPPPPRWWIPVAIVLALVLVGVIWKFLLGPPPNVEGIWELEGEKKAFELARLKVSMHDDQETYTLHGWHKPAAKWCNLFRVDAEADPSSDAVEFEWEGPEETFTTLKIQPIEPEEADAVPEAAIIALEILESETDSRSSQQAKFQFVTQQAAVAGAVAELAPPSAPILVAEPAIAVYGAAAASARLNAVVLAGGHVRALQRERERLIRELAKAKAAEKRRLQQQKAEAERKLAAAVEAAKNACP